MRSRIKANKGSMTLICVFIFFVFSTLGLGLLFLTQAYLKMSAYKKNVTFADYASENGIKRNFGHLAGIVSASYFPAVLSEDSYRDLMENARNGGMKIVEDALRIDLPLLSRETWGGQAWACSTQFGPSRIQEAESYFLAESRGEIASEGSLINSAWKRKSSCEICLRTLAGRVPLAYFPFLITQNMDSTRIASFKESQNLDFLPIPANQFFPQVSVTALPLIPDDPGPLLNKALNIKIFSPEKLSTAELRSALGLEPASLPVPDGVYLIKNDLGLGGVYVHGDVEEMVLAVESEFQVISVRLDSETWVLKYSPGQSRTQFSTPTGSQDFDLVPLGIIMVNGRINSLGGGIINPSGQAVLAPSDKIPNILQGVSLTIVSSDRTALSSPLIHQGLKWQNGIPYVKDQTSQLVVYSTGRDFWSDEDRDGRIIIDAEAPPEMYVQAAIVARDGFSIEGGPRKTLLIGGLQTSDLKTNDHPLTIAPDERYLSLGLNPQNCPATTSPLLFILGLKALQWNEY